MQKLIERTIGAFSSSKLRLPEASMEDVARHRAEYEAASKHGHETRDALIRLIWAQVHCRDRNQVHLGVRAADQLLTLKAADSDQQLRYLAAVGEFNLGRLTDARARLQPLVKENPNFSQGKNLLQACEDKLTNDTIAAGGVVAGVVGVSAVVATALLAGSSSKK